MSGGEFHEVARPSEKAVRKVAEEQPQEPQKTGRRWPRKPGAVAGEMVYIRVRKEVWDRARQLAEHPRNIQIINEGEVIVWKHGPPWPRREGQG